MHKCYSNRAYMHGYCSACILYFTNFFSFLHLTLFFSLDPFTLTSLLPLPITIALIEEEDATTNPATPYHNHPMENQNHTKPNSNQLKPTKKPIPNLILLLPRPTNNCNIHQGEVKNSTVVKVSIDQHQGEVKNPIWRRSASIKAGYLVEWETSILLHTGWVEWYLGGLGKKKKEEEKKEEMAER